MSESIKINIVYTPRPSIANENLVADFSVDIEPNDEGSINMAIEALDNAKRYFLMRQEAMISELKP